MRNMTWALAMVVGLGLGLGAGSVAIAAEAVQAQIIPATGVVQQVDAAAGKVKIAHDPIQALDWPKMTMFFRVKDAAVLEGVVQGDAVRFELEKGPTGMVITRIEKTAK